MKSLRHFPGRPRLLTRRAIIAVLCGSVVSGCATDPHTGQPSLKETFASDDPCSNNARNIGIATGAILGAILGNQVKHSNGARLAGAALGATAGGLIGADMDKRRCELSRIAKQYNLNLKTSTVSADGSVVDNGRPVAGANGQPGNANSLGTVVEVREQPGGRGHFDSNSDQLTEPAQQYFSAIADSYNARHMASDITDPQARNNYIAQISKRKILLIGHTDDTGNSRLNADLSERRAKAVADYMEKRGIPRESLYFQGAGEAYPVADNDTEGGRAQNRRVEIVEVADGASFDRFLSERKPRYEYYRPAESAPLRITSTAATVTPPAAETARPVRPPAPARPAPTKPGAAAGGASVAAAAGTPKPAPQPATATAAATAAASTGAGGIDFGGVPLVQSVALADIGQVAAPRTTFSLISTAYASEPAIIADCTRDRPRVANSVKTLSDGKTYRTSEHLPGLYGKTWTEQIHGHQVVLNKVAVLASNGAASNLPELKVYANYNPSGGRNPAPDVSINPEVNTYLGNKGLLYRMFAKGRGGIECIDVVFSSDGGTEAKAGKLVYTRAARLLAVDFKPKIYQK